MKYGYARGNTPDSIENQILKLKEEGLEVIYSEQVSGLQLKPQLEKLITIVKENDIIVIDTLARIGRDICDSNRIIDIIKNKNVELKIINQMEDADNSSIQIKLSKIFSSK